MQKLLKTLPDEALLEAIMTAQPNVRRFYLDSFNFTRHGYMEVEPEFTEKFTSPTSFLHAGDKYYLAFGEFQDGFIYAVNTAGAYNTCLTKKRFFEIVEEGVELYSFRTTVVLYRPNKPFPVWGKLPDEDGGMGDSGSYGVVLPVLEKPIDGMDYYTINNHYIAKIYHDPIKRDFRYIASPKLSHVGVRITATDLATEAFEKQRDVTYRISTYKNEKLLCLDEEY